MKETKNKFEKKVSTVDQSLQDNILFYILLPEQSTSTVWEKKAKICSHTTDYCHWEKAKEIKSHMKEKSKELLLLDQLLVKEMDLLKVKSMEVPLDSKLLEIK